MIRFHPLLQYIKNILIALDQFVNVVFFGDPDETISSRAYRLHRNSITWSHIMNFIDLLFFWDSFKTDSGLIIKHCELSFLMFLKRRHMTIQNHSKDYKDLVQNIKHYPLY